MRRRHTAIFALLFAGAGLAAGAVSAQSGSGLYLSLEVGLNVAPSVELLGNSTDRGQPLRRIHQSRVRRHCRVYRSEPRVGGRLENRL